MQIARIVVALALLGGTACADQVSKERFIESADAVCAEAEEKSRNLEPPRTPDQLSDFAEEAQAITAELLADLRELDMPDEGRETIEELYSKLQEALGYLPEIAEAARQKSSKRIQELGTSLKEASADANRLAQDYGLQVCGRSTQPDPPS